VPDLLQRKNRGKLTPGLLRKNSSEPGRLDIQEKGKKHQKMEGIILYDVVAEIEDDDLSSAPFFIQGFTWNKESAVSEVFEVKNVLSIHMMQRPAQLRAKLQENGSFLTER